MLIYQYFYAHVQKFDSPHPLQNRTTLQPLKLQGFSLFINAFRVFKCSFSAHCVSNFKHKKQHFIHKFYDNFTTTRRREPCEIFAAVVYKGFLFFVKRVIERALLLGSKGVERVDVLLYFLFLQARNGISACVLAVCIIVELVDIERDGIGYFHALRSFEHISEFTIAVIRCHVFTHFFNKFPA